MYFTAYGEIASHWHVAIEDSFLIQEWLLINKNYFYLYSYIKSS